MRNTARLFFMAACFFAALGLHAQSASPDTMVHRIFASLKAKDEKAFVALYPNPQQFGRFIRNLMTQTFKSEQMQQMLANDEKAKNLNVDSLIEAQVATVTSPAMFAQMEKQFGQMFQKVIEKGEKKGVNWSNATMTGYTVDSSSAMEQTTPMQPAGMKTLKGIIDFTAGGQPYQIAYDKVIFLPTEGAWFGADFTQLARKGESLAPDKEEEVKDEAVMPAPKQKTTTSKGKAPAAKAKTGKAPVRKKA